MTVNESLPQKRVRGKKEGRTLQTILKLFGKNEKKTRD